MDEIHVRSVRCNFCCYELVCMFALLGLVIITPHLQFKVGNHSKVTQYNYDVSVEYEEHRLLYIHVQCAPISITFDSALFKTSRGMVSDN